MGTANSGLSIAQQMAADGSLPDLPDTGVPMRAVVSAVSTTNPDAEAKTQQLAQRAGMGVDLTRSNPQAAQQRATAADLERRELEIRNPILASQLRDPNFATVAHDDLDSLSRIDEGAQQLRGNGGGFPQRADAEVGSLAGNIYGGFFGAIKPLIDAPGAFWQGGAETVRALADKAVMGPDYGDPLSDTLHNIWVAPRTPEIQQRVTDPIHRWLTQGIIPGAPEYMVDPATGGQVKNPDYHWYGRSLGNALEQVPGTLAAFMLTGKAGGMAGETAAAEGDLAESSRLAGSVPAGAAVERQVVPAILGTQSAQTTYAQARAKGADQKTAVMAALSSGMINYGLMGMLPGPVQASSIKGAIGQWAGRSAAMGGSMTVADNTIARSYDPDRGALEGLPQSIATMAAFEGVGAVGQFGEPMRFQRTVNDMIEATAASKLRERAPDVFHQAMDAQFEGDPSFRVPAQDFVNYFTEKKLDPALMANRLGVSNLGEASAAGSDLEIPKANFFARLDPEHARELLPDLVDPSTDLSARQAEAGKAELRSWAANGGIEKLQQEYAQADAETQATPEWKNVYGDLKQRYVDAGETEPAAENYATLHANAIANLAKNAGLKPDELLALHNPDIRKASPDGNVLYQSEAPIGGQEGRETTLLTPTREIPAKYRLVEADDLKPSHNAQTFARNPGYPDGLQERAYDTSKEAQARVIQQSQNYDPRYTVNTNPDAVNGPPVVTPDGLVLGGNSRAMSTQRLYAKDGSAYKEALKEQSAAYGFTPEQVDAMKKPVLVRQIDSPASADEARRIGSELNKSMTGAMGVSERAVSAGKNIKPETLRNVSGMMQVDDSTLREALSKHGAEFVKMLTADGVITERERPQFVDPATGGLNEEGKAFVERALMGSVIDDPRLMDSAPKSVLGKLERSLGSITSFASRPDEWNLLPVIREAVAELGSIQRDGSTVALRLGQTALFGEERNPLVDAMVRALDGKPNGVREAFDNYAHDSGENMPGQSRMFGEAKAFDAFNHAFGSKLSEQEFHDGREAARNDPSSPGVVSGERPGRDESVSGSADRDASLGGPESVAGLRGGEPDAGIESGTGSGSRVGGEPAAADEHAPNDGVSGKRGWFRILPDGRYEIGKTKIGDFSTFIHEPAHAYLEMFRELTQREGASDALKDDFKKICEWLGTTPEDAYRDGFTHEQHEEWARANEQYVREGNAPTSGLKRAFQYFSVWLGSIYRRASSLGVELSPEIRGVMYRLYAGDDAVNRAEQEAPQRLFNNPEEAGWTEEEYKNYAASKGLEVTEAKTQLIREMHEAWLREKTQAWREEKGNVRDALTQEIDARPEYTAIRSLRRGKLDQVGEEAGSELTLNRAELVRQFGEDRVKALQKLHPGLYRAQGGTDAETAAEILGFGSGEEMMRALEGAPRRSQAIEGATRDYMTAKHGDIRYDGSLDQKARVAMENDERAKSLHSEVKVLRARVEVLQKRAADTKTAMASISIAPLEHYQETARQMIEDKAIADLQPNRYLNASRMFSREAFDAARRGDAQRAAEAKNKELLNHFLFREASKAQDYADKFESYAKRMQSRGIQQRLGLADVQSGKDYRDQFNWLLARYKLSAPMAKPERSLRVWAEDVYGAGNEPAIAPQILNEGHFGDYRNVPLSEVRDLHDALINVRHLAMQEFKMYVQGKQVDFADARKSMVDSARENLRTKPEKVFEENRSLAEKAASGPEWADSRLIRMERLIEWLDGGKAGPWHDNLWNLAADAEGDERRLQEDVTGRVFDGLESMPAEMRRRLWTEKVSVDGVDEPLTRRRMLSIAFNMGNEGNLDRLRKTFAAFGWDPNAVEKIGGMVTREEWQFVQKSWDSLKPLGERMQELEKRLTGLPPAMVKVTPFKVALDDGTEMDLAGGYFPIVMDPRFSDKGIQQDAKETAQNAMQSGYVRATTSKGYTKERTGFGGPLLLDYEQALTNHVAKVTKDLSHREFMLSSQRLLLDKEVQKTLRETLGPAYEKQFMPWLRNIINDNNGSVQERLDGIKDAMQTLRSNFVASALSFNPGTMLLQISHAPRMMLYASRVSLAQSLADFIARPVEATREIRELSPNEMRFRGDNLDRDLRTELQKPEYTGGYARKVAAAGRLGLQVTDHLFSHVLWRAAYSDALGKYADLAPGDAQQKAVYEADSAVRLGLGAQAPKDLPAIMRNNEFNKFITTLYGFHNGVYNQLRDNAHQARYGTGSVGGRATKLTYATLLTAVVPALLGSMLTGRGPKDGENIGWWAAKRSLLFSADTVPMLRAISSAIETGGDVQLSPLESVMTKGAKAGMEAASDKEDKNWLGIGLDAGEVAGETFGAPGTHQAVKTLRYLHRASQGKVENPSVWGAVVGGR